MHAVSSFSESIGYSRIQQQVVKEYLFALIMFAEPLAVSIDKLAKLFDVCQVML